MRLLLSLLAATLTLPLAVAAQQPKRPITFADLMAMRRVSDPQISPSGKWVLFSVTDVSLEHNTKTNHLWIVPLGAARTAGVDGGDASGSGEHQLTFGDGESNGRFAPDGKTIALTMKDQIYTMPWDDATGTVGDPTQITNVNGGADGAIWSPDSKRLLFTVDVYPECSDQPDWDKEDACDTAKQKAADASPVKTQIWTHLLYRHWDHYLGNRRSHIAAVDADGHNLRDLTPHSAVGDAETPTFSLGGPLGYAWSPDSREIAYVTNLEVGFAKPGVFPQPGESTNNDIFTLKLDEPNAKAVKVSTSPGSDDGPQYSPDGKWLAWRSQARNGYESDKFDLVVMDRATHSIRNLTTKFDDWVDAFSWIDDSQHLFFSSPRNGAEALFHVNVTADSMNSMTKGGGEWNEFTSRLIDGREHIIGTRMWVDRPTEIFNIDALQLDDAVQPIIVQHGSPANSDHKLRIGKDAEPPATGQLTNLNTEILSELELAPLESFWFPGANNTKVQGFLIKPPNFDPSKKYPVKFLIHGGPQGAWGDAWSYRWNPELFAANGYVVVMINPRGSTGYGQKFLEEVSGDWGGRPYIDLMKGLDFAEAKYPFIDKNRECALGASYGGYMADWVLTHTNRFKCIVTHDGMSDPAAAFGTTEELWFMEWEFRQLATTNTSAKGLSSRSGTDLSSRSEAKGSASRTTTKHDASAASDAVVEQTHPSHPWDFYNTPDSANPYIKWSPMRFIKDAHTPTLIVHSQRDMRLDVSQGLELFTALQLLGVPSKMLYFPDEGHWILKPQNSQLWNEQVSDWCDRWLGMNKYASTGPEPNPAAPR
jgi:dipeptidyl aminopeptidase/acylaminoacyl peptidase